MVKKKVSMAERLVMKLDEQPKVEVTDITYTSSANTVPSSSNTKDNVDIFVGAYKDYESPVSNKAYKIIVGNHDVEFTNGLEVIKCGNKDDVLDDRFYSEQYMLKWLVDHNYPFKEYVGFSHYRKYFKFLDEIPNLDEIFKEYDCIVPRPISLSRGVRKQYATAHNIEDLEIVEGIIKEKYPEYYDMCEKFLDGKLMIPYEMYIMKREDFIDYVKFIHGVLSEYIKVVGTDIEGRIKYNSDKYLKGLPPNTTPEYQYRIGGYLSERLTNIYLMHRFKKMKIYGTVITESKYPNEMRKNGKKDYVRSMLRIDDDGLITESKTRDGKTIIKLYDVSELVYEGSFSDLLKIVKDSKKREAEN